MGKKKEGFWTPETSFSSWGMESKKKKKGKKDKDHEKKKKDSCKKDKKDKKSIYEFDGGKKDSHDNSKKKSEPIQYKELLRVSPPGLYQVVSNILEDDLEIYIIKPETGFPIELTTGDNYKMFVTGTLSADCEYSVNKVMYSSMVSRVKIDKTLERVLVDYVSTYNASNTDSDADDGEDEE